MSDIVPCSRTCPFLAYDTVNGPYCVGCNFPQAVCGCGEAVTLDWANDNGFTCEPVNTTHSQHIDTIRSDR